MFQQKPKHIIVLMHGIGGHKRHFGYMAPALRTILNRKDPDVKYLIKHIEYDTGDETKTPFDFSRDISPQLTRILSRFRSGDKLSLILHSQGGLVASIWLLRSLRAEAGYTPPYMIGYVDAFITLGTPFWGAKTALWGYQLKQILKRFKIKDPWRFGEQELAQMSFGSDMIDGFRQVMISADFQNERNWLKENIRFLNVAGVADLLNPLGVFVSGTEKYEDDGAVPLASARYNFLYHQSLKENYDEGYRSGSEGMREMDWAPMYVVNAMHRSPLPEQPGWAGLPQIPKRCVLGQEDGHPVLPMISKFLIKESVESYGLSTEGFRSFALDLNLRVQVQQTYALKDLKIDFFQPDGQALNRNIIDLMPLTEVYSSWRVASENQPNVFRFHFRGNIRKPTGDQPTRISIRLGGPGLKSRWVDAEVRPAYSSYIDVNLESNKEASHV